MNATGKAAEVKNRRMMTFHIVDICNVELHLRGCLYRVLSSRGSSVNGGHACRRCVGVSPC